MFLYLGMRIIFLTYNTDKIQHKELAHNIMLDYYELARHDYNITKIKNKTL